MALFMYIISLYCMFEMCYNFICQLYLNKTEKKYWDCRTLRYVWLFVDEYHFLYILVQ